jgi:hypothetical protein
LCRGFGSKNPCGGYTNVGKTSFYHIRCYFLDAVFSIENCLSHVPMYLFLHVNEQTTELLESRVPSHSYMGSHDGLSLSSLPAAPPGSRISGAPKYVCKTSQSQTNPNTWYPILILPLLTKPNSGQPTSSSAKTQLRSTWQRKLLRLEIGCDSCPD